MRIAICPLDCVSTLAHQLSGVVYHFHQRIYFVGFCFSNFHFQRINYYKNNKLKAPRKQELSLCFRKKTIFANLNKN